MSLDTEPVLQKVSYRIHEWCKATGLSRSYIYDAIKAGDLTITKIGRATIIMRDDGMNWLNSHRSKGRRAA